MCKLQVRDRNFRPSLLSCFRARTLNLDSVCEKGYDVINSNGNKKAHEAVVEVQLGRGVFVIPRLSMVSLASLFLFKRLSEAISIYCRFATSVNETKGNRDTRGISHHSAGEATAR